MTEIAQMLACLQRIESQLAAILATSRKCEECGIRFAATVTARRRFCSDYCRVKWHRLNNPQDAAQ